MYDTLLSSLTLLHIFDCTLRNEINILETRELLWNHIDYALGSRLRSLKDALPSFCTEFSKQNSKTTKTAGSSGASVQSDPKVLASISLPPNALGVRRASRSIIHNQICANGLHS